MKCFLKIAITLFPFTMFSCSGNRERVVSEKCLPALVSIVYLGENDKPKHPLVIRTDEKDSSYLEFTESKKEKLEKNGFIMSREDLIVYTISSETYHVLKKYIVTNNTHKERTVFNVNNNNTMKIILKDYCDSVAYAVDKENKGYFLEMIDTLNLEDNEFKSYLKYYDEIQENGGSMQTTR